ncbi:alpha-amylase family glycosyl hydrolase [Agilicoccus flavus]|uniref:alpha-amylase family glycosyl hydrolase n=1 Tax=Agilicoccus flavus TaxID=2775968 RepID=UPI001CF63DFB|nr:alpha-amylase family glycosyl hydrolase [Agilicoccus flavus]
MTRPSPAIRLAAAAVGTGLACSTLVPASAAAAPTSADSSPTTAARPAATPASGPATPAAPGPSDRALARDSVRPGPTRERFYFVMADRFANGSTANDRGGLTGGPLRTGFAPTHKGFFHGGDLAGLTGKLDYIKGMGTTAIWLTPSFKNRPVQGGPGTQSAGYHGYWVTDFTRIDPHFGTNEEMKSLIAAAHAKGMKVYFDIITNHTADVIGYAEKTYTYRDKKTYPYKDASGKVFDDRDHAGRSSFPRLDPKVSFPYTPTFASPGDASVKVPSWLNDPTMYHNRGDTTFEGENSLYGDFFGLDDLFTERPEVVRGMGDIYAAWIDLGIDGFRIDTTKHVNMEFWQAFAPRMMQHAAAVGRGDFFMFGEVASDDPVIMSEYPTKGKLPATLDFGFQKAAQNFVAGKPAADLARFYVNDDLYTDADSNAYSLPTFTGNHDMGRLPMLLTKDGVATRTLYPRVRLANELMFLTRGQPITYYGDEQGFIGGAGDQDARQDMFATKTPLYANQTNLIGRAGARDRFDARSPLYRQIAGLSRLRAAHPALADGAQLPRYAAASAGVFAVSRVDARAHREYVVAANNSTRARTATFATSTSRARFAPLHGTRRARVSDRAGRLTVTVPPLSTVVYRADRAVDAHRAAPRVTLQRAFPRTADGRTRITANVPANRVVQATFLARPAGTTRWSTLGTDDNAPYRVFADTARWRTGTRLEYRVVVKDEAGRVRGASTTATAP